MGDAIKGRTVVLGAMTTAELADAVQLPAVAVCVEVEPVFVDRITADAALQPGARPLVQHTSDRRGRGARRRSAARPGQLTAATASVCVTAQVVEDLCGDTEQAVEPSVGPRPSTVGATSGRRGVAHQRGVG
jgi:Novel STAND NTPase 1